VGSSTIGSGRSASSFSSRLTAAGASSADGADSIGVVSIDDGRSRSKRLPAIAVASLFVCRDHRKQL
jgi:hypothetical protein